MSSAKYDSGKRRCWNSEILFLRCIVQLEHALVSGSQVGTTFPFGLAHILPIADGCRACCKRGFGLLFGPMKPGVALTSSEAAPLLTHVLSLPKIASAGVANGLVGPCGLLLISGFRALEESHVDTQRSLTLPIGLFTQELQLTTAEHRRSMPQQTLSQCWAIAHVGSFFVAA